MKYTQIKEIMKKFGWDEINEGEFINDKLTEKGHVVIEIGDKYFSVFFPNGQSDEGNYVENLQEYLANLHEVRE